MAQVLKIGGSPDIPGKITATFRPEDQRDNSPHWFARAELEIDGRKVDLLDVVEGIEWLEKIFGENLRRGLFLGHTEYAVVSIPLERPDGNDMWYLDFTAVESDDDDSRFPEEEHYCVEVAVRIAGKNRKAEMVDNVLRDTFIHDAKELFADSFDGFEARAVEGGYRGKNGKLMEEPTVVLSSLVNPYDRLRGKTIAKLLGFCIRYGRQTEQSEIMFTVGTENHCIELAWDEPA